MQKRQLCNTKNIQSIIKVDKQEMKVYANLLNI